MSLKRKLEGAVEIRAGAGDVYHKVCESKPHHISHVTPHFVETCDVIEGELGKHGAIVLWKYKTGGKPLIAKVLVEEINKGKRLVRQRCIEGDMLEEYKSISGTGQVVPKDSETSIVRWTLEYEKLHPGAPEPTALLDHMLNAAKDIDDHHHGIKK